MKKILIILFLFSGCSSRPVNPIPTPSYERLSIIKGQINANTAVVQAINLSETSAINYLKAMKAESLGNTKDACSLFSELSEDRNFPLNQTSLVHTLNNCTFTEGHLKKIWKDTIIADYLKETYLDYSIKLAQQYKMKEFIAQFSFELVTFKAVQAEKVKLLQTAISIAQELKLTEDESRYFQKLVEVSPLFSPDVTKENMYSVARDFETNRHFEKARSMYLDIINSDEFNLDEKIKTYNSYRMSFKVARDLKTFLEKTGEMELFLRQLLELDPDDTKLQEAWVDAKLTYARAVWTEHLNAEARALLDDIIMKKIGNANQMATVYWVYGSLHVESKENAEALLKFEKASKYKVSSLDQQENIQWALVWNKYLIKKYEDVLVDADRFIKSSSNPNFSNKLSFWKARALVKLGRIDEAEEVFSKTATEDEFGYYGLVSAMEIKLPLEPLPPSTINTDPIGNMLLDWLIAMDEKNFSTKVLKEINSQFKTISERERAMSLYAQSGWYQGGMVQIYNFPIKLRNELTKKHISVVFPTPFEDIFTKYSEKYKIPKALPYAISRQESAFNPNVRSWADAFGLMQMIPEKAKELSKKYSIPYKDFNDLYKPEPNVEMGVALLAELKVMFNGKFAQNTAGYNASTAVIAVWEKERFNGDYLEFIEMIPYEETRNYIKLVFRNFMTYKRIMGNEEIIIPQDFFEQPYN